MDVILHLGAHRTGSTSFQFYLRNHAEALGEHHVGFWGPFRLRRRLLQGVITGPHLNAPHKAFARAKGRIGLALSKSEQAGIKKVLVSEENILGSMRANIASASLYPHAGDRVARHMAAFSGRITGISIAIRGLDTWWPSALTFCIPRGSRIPKADKIARLANQPRNWRDVITDIATAVPGIPITVSTFEQTAPCPDHLASSLLGINAPRPAQPIWRNRRMTLRELMALPMDTVELTRLLAAGANEKWQPFDDATRANLRERYADDLFWLQSGADGLAQLIEGPSSGQTAKQLLAGGLTRGQYDDDIRRLAEDSRERAAWTATG